MFPNVDRSKLVLAVIVGTWIIGVSGTCGVKADSYDDRMAALRRTDPKLVIYKESKRISTGLKQPSGIALTPDGRLYVAGDKAVIEFGADGARRSGFRVAENPYCLAVAPSDGRVYVGMRGHVEVFDKAGKALARWASLGENAYITSISCGTDGVWVADAGNRVILKYNVGGQVVGTFGKKDAARKVPGLVAPSPHLDVAAAWGGAVWAANPGRHVLELYAPDGTIKRSWGRASFAIDGFSGCCNPTDFALLPGGGFVTSEKGLPRVKVYGADGKFAGVVAGFETFSPEVVGLDLAVDSKGRVYVLDPASKTVRVYVQKEKAKK